MDNYAIYLRKSRLDREAEARGEGETLARHQQSLFGLAQQQNLSVTGIYKEVVSGETIANRPQMQRLLQDVEAGAWRGVLVMEVERLARGETIDQGIVAETFKYAGTKIITPNKTFDPSNEFDEEYFEFNLFMSRKEYTMIKRRLRRGREASVKEGKYVGSKAPYGYTRKKLEHAKGYTLKPHPEEADIIRLIYELYTQGERQPDGNLKRLGVSLISRKLNGLNIKPAKAEAWVAGSVRDIIINPVYKGMVRWNWRPQKKRRKGGSVEIERPRVQNCIIIKGLHDAIIDEATWDLAQAYMQQNTPHPAPSKYAVKNPLSGVVYCGKCGRSMSRRPHGKSQEDTLMCPAVFCGNVSSKLSIVESRVITALEAWLTGYTLEYDGQKQSNSQLEIKQKALKKLDESIRNLKKQKDELHNLLEQKTYTPDVFLERSGILAGKLRDAEQERSIFVKDIEADIERENARRHIIPQVDEIIDIYKAADSPKIKNDFLKEVLRRVNYIKTASTRWHGDPYDFELELFPILPCLATRD